MILKIEARLSYYLSGPNYIVKRKRKNFRESLKSSKIMYKENHEMKNLTIAILYLKPVNKSMFPGAVIID